MNSRDNLDVLVVYSACDAISAASDDLLSRHPFALDSKQANYNLSYAYFLKECDKTGLKAGLTTSADIIGPGLCDNYWSYVEDNWVKVDRKAKSCHVFDKLSPRTSTRAAERRLLLSDEAVYPFNDRELFKTFFDKLKTYQKLPAYAIPTAEVCSDEIEDIKAAVREVTELIDSHKFSSDFDDKLVLKDRFGAGGSHVYKIGSNFVSRIRSIMKKYPHISFVIQPFLAFENGYTYRNQKAATDIRLIFHNDELLQSYIRLAKDDDFRCNEHQGGKLVYVDQSDIPDRIHEISRKIVRQIGKPQSLYALDFVVSNSGMVYFLEGNSGPGIDWDIKKKHNEIKSKELIRKIVKEFESRIANQVALTQRV
jgi:glutathione synthase/RimK-type ligase-like ATP-grasp enzyme